MNNPIDTLWGHLTARIDEICAMDNNINVNIKDDFYGFMLIDQDEIKYDDKTIFYKLKANTTLTIFEKSDYEAVAPTRTDGGKMLAQSEITRLFEFSKYASPVDIFDNWNE